MESNLSVHIQKALKVVLDRPYREILYPEIFQPSEFSPKLSHDRDNWILHYGGAFNPPHAGHLAVLSCALTNHGARLNIIAAMIDPKDDAYLMGKNAETKETFIVTKTDRASLWRSAESFPRSAWVERILRSRLVDGERRNQLIKIRRDLRSNSDDRDIADIADMALSSKMLLDLLKRGLILQSSGAQNAT